MFRLTIMPGIRWDVHLQHASRLCVPFGLLKDLFTLTLLFVLLRLNADTTVRLETFFWCCILAVKDVKRKCFCQLFPVFIPYKIKELLHVVQYSTAISKTPHHRCSILLVRVLFATIALPLLTPYLEIMYFAISKFSIPLSVLVLLDSSDLSTVDKKQLSIALFYCCLSMIAWLVKCLKRSIPPILLPWCANIQAYD